VRPLSNVLRISDAASLGLHAMVLLAVDSQEEISTRKIASELQVSEAHLSKVLQRLGKVGLVASTRGPKGGFALGRKAEEITLLEVYEAIDGPLVPNNCLLGSRICGGERCILGDLLERIDRQVREYLATARLNELTSVYVSKARQRGDEDTDA
jgi:Rrf2 family protein